jgi:hypothetical protein
MLEVTRARQKYDQYLGEHNNPTIVTDPALQAEMRSLVKRLQGQVNANLNRLNRELQDKVMEANRRISLIEHSDMPQWQNPMMEQGSLHDLIHFYPEVRAAFLGSERLSDQVYHAMELSGENVKIGKRLSNIQDAIEYLEKLIRDEDCPD